jgi:hypothetical protein
MMSRHLLPPRCTCLACQLGRVLELLHTGRTDAAHVELERITMAVRREQATRCTQTGSIPLPHPPVGPEAA